MENMNIIPIILFFMGVAMIFIGLFLSIYPKHDRYMHIKNNTPIIEQIAQFPFIRNFLSFFTCNKNGKPYKFIQEILDYTETMLSAQSLYLLKIISLIVVSIMCLSVKYTNINYVLEEKTKNLMGNYELVQKLPLIDFQIIFIIIASFFIPEILLLFKKLLLYNQYKKEVIRLENVFELLGNANNFKTIDILHEMSECSKAYKKHLSICVENFQIDKAMALETLKGSVKNKRFSRLVEVLRIYTMVNKKLAMDILFRNRMEKEEQALITSQEDIDIIDIIAFVSLVPLIYEMCNLLVRPMMRMIFDAFKYI